MNVTIYTPNEAIDTSTGSDAKAGRASVNYTASILVPRGESEVIVVHEGGRAFYLHGLGQPEGYYTADAYEWIPEHLRRRFDLMIEQHHLDIVSVINRGATNIEDYLYDVVLNADTVLAAGTQLYKETAIHAQ